MSTDLKRYNEKEKLGNEYLEIKTIKCYQICAVQMNIYF